MVNAGAAVLGFCQKGVAGCKSTCASQVRGGTGCSTKTVSSCTVWLASKQSREEPVGPVTLSLLLRSGDSTHLVVVLNCMLLSLEMCGQLTYTHSAPHPLKTPHTSSSTGRCRPSPPHVLSTTRTPGLWPVRSLCAPHHRHGGPVVPQFTLKGAVQ
jgi:hypothetical protein